MTASPPNRDELYSNIRLAVGVEDKVSGGKELL
jgi:hypothetical protein